MAIEGIFIQTVAKTYRPEYLVIVLTV